MFNSYEIILLRLTKHTLLYFNTSRLFDCFVLILKVINVAPIGSRMLILLVIHMNRFFSKKCGPLEINRGILKNVLLYKICNYRPRQFKINKSI